MLEFIIDRANYWAIIGLMMIGLYITFASSNLIKRLVGLSIFQTSVFLFYITLGKVAGGTAPILYGKDVPKGHGDAAHGGGGDVHHSALEAAGDVMLAAGKTGARHAELYNTYSNPLPHVLILTAIVVGVATLAIGLALTVRIREVYGSIEEDQIDEADYVYNLEGTADYIFSPEAGAS